LHEQQKSYIIEQNKIVKEEIKKEVEANSRSLTSEMRSIQRDSQNAEVKMNLKLDQLAESLRNVNNFQRRTSKVHSVDAHAMGYGLFT